MGDREDLTGLWTRDDGGIRLVVDRGHHGVFVIYADLSMCWRDREFILRHFSRVDGVRVSERHGSHDGR